MIRTDIGCRAVPWTRLILESKKAPEDLNLKRGQRLSVVLAGLSVLFLFLAAFRLELLSVSAGALAGVTVLNRDLYAFFFRRRGLFFTIACIPLHLLYYLYGGVTFLYVWLDFQLRGAIAPQPKVKRRI
jgi:hypothetical protein